MLKNAAISSLNIFLIFFFVLLVNLPIIQFAMLYPEQPSIYLANQEITNFKDILNVYLHPILFDNAIPFFRPSGHFLIYQFLTLFLSWHNTKAFIIVNLFFLSLCGFLIIKIYSLLFPRFKVGGYIAFALYLMHPALSLSRLIALHFEFSYVFFLLLSLYCFLLFCEKNSSIFKKIGEYSQATVLLMAAFLFYLIAITFKEAALILGPLWIIYFCLLSYVSSLKKTFYFILQQKELLKILLLCCFVSLTLIIYLTLSWPTLLHPTRSSLSMQNLYASTLELFKMLGGWYTASQNPNLQFSDMMWRVVIYPKWVESMIWFFWGMIWLSVIALFFAKNKLRAQWITYRKNFIFLCIAVVISLILPIGWGMGLGWHLNLTLLFLSLLMGFSFEFIFKKFNVKMYAGYALALIVGLASWSVNRANVDRYDKNPHEHYILSVVRNAVLSPPKLEHKLNDQSILVVEDSKIHNPYMLGNSLYPLFLATNYAEIAEVQPFYFLKADDLYNGHLFRFAYLKPHLKEEVYPFVVNKMNEVASGAIYHWLKHINNIFCVGYDESGLWYDKTAEFKKNLLKEQERRSLNVSLFSEQYGVKLSGQILYRSDVLIPNALMCQMTCDQDKSCLGFTLVTNTMFNKKISQCQFYGALRIENEWCASCLSYVKQV